MLYVFFLSEWMIEFWSAFFTIPVGVALLPFVDEKRLQESLAKVYPDITEEESKNMNPIKLQYAPM